MRSKARVLIFDFHPIVRMGLKALIDRRSDFSVCACSGNGEEALSLLESMKPDLVVVGMSLPERVATRLIGDMRRLSDAPILALSNNTEPLFAEQAAHAGADAYLRKTEPVRRVLAVLKELSAGGRHVSEHDGEPPSRTALKRRSGSHTKALSGRELQVLKRIARGAGTRAIAANLGLSVKTIETYRENIKRKLELQNAVELVRHAVLLCGLPPKN